MDTPEPENRKILWGKCLLNGLLAWVLGFVLYMIPAFVVAIQMGFDLGPKLKDNAAVSRQISEAISDMYRSNSYLAIGLVLAMAALTYWRSRRVARTPPIRYLTNGAIVGSVPALITLAVSAFRGITIGTIVEIVIFIAAGVVGSLKAKPAAEPG
jgi:hypothetical protein